MELNNDFLYYKSLDVDKTRVEVFDKIRRLNYDLHVPYEKFLFVENDEYYYRLIPEGWGIDSNTNLNISPNPGALLVSQPDSIRNETFEIKKNISNRSLNLILRDKNIFKSNRKSDERIPRYFDNYFEENLEDIIITKQTKKIDIFSIPSLKKERKKNPSPNIFSLDIIKIPSQTRSKMIIKCKFCEKSDHLSKDCPMELDCNDLCIICLSTKHESDSCPFQKCIRCNRLGHISSECSSTKSIVKCTICRNIGHGKEDCLQSPLPITPADFKRAYCFLCGDIGHYICTYGNIKYEEMNIYSDDSNLTEPCENLHKKKSSKISLDLLKLYCPNCCEEHLLSECRKNKIKNKLDDKRKELSKYFFKLAPSKLAKDKNFLNESFSSDDEEVSQRCGNEQDEREQVQKQEKYNNYKYSEKEIKISLNKEDIINRKYVNLKLLIH